MFNIIKHTALITKMQSIIIITNYVIEIKIRLTTMLGGFDMLI